MYRRLLPRFDKLDGCEDPVEFDECIESFKDVSVLYAWNERIPLIKKIMEIRRNSTSPFKPMRRSSGIAYALHSQLGVSQRFLPNERRNHELEADLQKRFELYEKRFYDEFWPITQERLNDPNWVEDVGMFNSGFANHLYMMSCANFVRMYEVDSAICGRFPEN